jgi:hypothetical protein
VEDWPDSVPDPAVALTELFSGAVRTSLGVPPGEQVIESVRVQPARPRLRKRAHVVFTDESFFEALVEMNTDCWVMGGQKLRLDYPLTRQERVKLDPQRTLVCLDLVPDLPGLEGSLAVVFEKVAELSAKPGEGDPEQRQVELVRLSKRERLARVQLAPREVADRCYSWFEKGAAVLELQGGGAALIVGRAEGFVAGESSPYLWVPRGGHGAGRRTVEVDIRGSGQGEGGRVDGGAVKAGLEDSVGRGGRTTRKQQASWRKCGCCRQCRGCGPQRKCC